MGIPRSRDSVKTGIFHGRAHVAALDFRCALDRHNGALASSALIPFVF
jgi:hypothetical protein